MGVPEAANYKRQRDGQPCRIVIFWKRASGADVHVARTELWKFQFSSLFDLLLPVIRVDTIDARWRNKGVKLFGGQFLPSLSTACQ